MATRRVGSWSLLPMVMATASAQLLDRLSFGQKTPISQDPTHLPYYAIYGTNHQVHMLSDRVILTPPVPGNARGALWSHESLSSTEWTAELEFRASGQENGLGNLQLWYTKNKESIHLESVYTVGKFDGMVLVLDQYGGTGGKIRGFLNDGGQNYRGHNNLESLAFGHCDYAYRNLGRPSKLRVTHSNGLTVHIDEKECFKTDKISLPSGYYFGISGATGENPDSFEINKFLVTNGVKASSAPPQQSKPAQADPKKQQSQGHAQSRPEKHISHPESSSKNPPAVSQDQFAQHQANFQETTQKVLRAVADLNAKLEQKHEQVISGMPKSSQEEILNLMRRVENMEKTLASIEASLRGYDYTRQLSELQKTIDRVSSGINEHLPDNLGKMISSSGPKIGTFVFVLVLVQVALAGVYIVYKKQRDSPKKYL